MRRLGAGCCFSHNQDAVCASLLQDSSELKKQREKALRPPLNTEPDADAWEPFGKAWQLYLKQVDMAQGAAKVSAVAQPGGSGK